jgi:hypothetical protein
LIDDPKYLEVRLDLQKRLHAALEDESGRGVVPFTYKYNQGAVFRSEAGSDVADFPKRWVKPENNPERLEHFLPDSPQKANILPGLTKAFEENEARIRAK